MLGKVKLGKIMSRETKIPYSDVSAYGRYIKHGINERFEIGGRTLSYVGDRLFLVEPDYSHEKITSKRRAVKL